MDVKAGTVVRDRTWGGRFSGTVVGRKDRSVFVAWHNSCAEDELDIDQVEIWPDAPTELTAWRGSLGRLNTDGSLTIEPIAPTAK
jgi:hypothetical protein